MADFAELDRLVLEHLPAALRFATRMTGDRDAAEDLVQDALLRIARSWQTFRGSATFRTWFYRVLINVFRDRLRSNRTFSIASIDEAEETPDPRSVSPPTAAATNELADRVAAEVSRLPLRQREVMVLTAFEGLSIVETAGLLDITEQNVHATLSAARARLRSRLAAYLGFAEK
ncbi:MAG TPA: sigma-70 family RNA polymerase sigma factor [Pirellulales bacterium]|nr:sigma-70 family RNA polymerase sigma factor [Pirellulales bacterium]